MIISYEIRKGVVQLSVAHVIRRGQRRYVYFNSHDSDLPWLLFTRNHRRYHFNILHCCIENEIGNLQTRHVLLHFFFNGLYFLWDTGYDTLFKYRAGFIFVVFYLSSLFFDLIGTDIFLFSENVDATSNKTLSF